ncbi:hypothetical protein, partial [Desulfosporosinus fructosivorans]
VYIYILIGSIIKRLSGQKVCSEIPELWLSWSGIVAHFAPDYSLKPHLMMVCWGTYRNKAIKITVLWEMPNPTTPGTTGFLKTRNL